MIEFKLPSMGADMDEGTLLEWKVKPGDTVKKGQVIAVVDTSKAAVDVESWQEGTVDELVVEPGDKFAVGSLMATFLEPGEAPGATRRVPTPSGATTALAATSRRKVSPAARKRAGECGIDIDAIAGTGPGGAVTLSTESTTRREAMSPPPCPPAPSATTQ